MSQTKSWSFKLKVPFWNHLATCGHFHQLPRSSPPYDMFEYPWAVLIMCIIFYFELILQIIVCDKLPLIIPLKTRNATFPFRGMIKVFRSKTFISFSFSYSIPQFHHVVKSLQKPLLVLKTLPLLLEALFGAFSRESW